MKTGKCKETIDKNLQTPSFEKLEEIAKSLAQKNRTTVEKEFQKLAKQKVLISGVPFLFSIGFMGFFVAGISNLFTKYRYNQEKKNTLYTNQFTIKSNTQNETFKTFFS